MGIYRKTHRYLQTGSTTTVEERLDFEEWLKYGYDQRWIGPPVCSNCDGVPVYEDEVEADACVHILRLYRDEMDKMMVENDHPPSVWRATNRWGKEDITYSLINPYCIRCGTTHAIDAKCGRDAG